LSVRCGWRRSLGVCWAPKGVGYGKSILLRLVGRLFGWWSSIRLDEDLRSGRRGAGGVSTGAHHGGRGTSQLFRTSGWPSSHHSRFMRKHRVLVFRSTWGAAEREHGAGRTLAARLRARGGFGPSMALPNAPGRFICRPDGQADDAYRRPGYWGADRPSSKSVANRSGLIDEPTTPRARPIAAPVQTLTGFMGKAPSEGWRATAPLCGPDSPWADSALGSRQRNVGLRLGGPQ